MGDFNLNWEDGKRKKLKIVADKFNLS